MKHCLLLIAILGFSFGHLSAQARIAEIADIEGVRDNVISGVGLVIGLNGNGDKSPAAAQMIANIYDKYGFKTTPATLGIGNAAVVHVSARLDPFKRKGSRLDIQVASMLDAKDLFGGLLMETYLYGRDHKTVYAIAEGPLSAPGLAAAGSSGSSVVVNHPTAAAIPSGAVVEKVVEMKIKDARNVITFHLKNWNFKTATNVAKAINEKHPESANPVGGGVVEVKVPLVWHARLTEFIAGIQELRVEIDVVSKVIVNRKTGVIVAGKDVRISTVAVTQGTIGITIQEEPLPVTAAPFTEGPSIAAVPRSDVTISEGDKGIQVIDGGVSIASLAQSLSALQVSPSQLISILEAIKAQGALHADLEVR